MSYSDQLERAKNSVQDKYGQPPVLSAEEYGQGVRITPSSRVTVCIFFDGLLWQYDVIDEREPRMRMTGAHEHFDRAIRSVQEDLGFLRSDR